MSSSAGFLPASLHIPQHMLIAHHSWGTFCIPLPALMCAVSSYNAEGQRISVLALAQINVSIFSTGGKVFENTAWS